jgi:hypothetical protein
LKRQHGVIDWTCVFAIGRVGWGRAAQVVAISPEWILVFGVSGALIGGADYPAMAPSPLLLSSDALSGQDAAHELDKQVERAEQLKSILQTSELVWQGRAGQSAATGTPD